MYQILNVKYQYQTPNLPLASRNLHEELGDFSLLLYKINEKGKVITGRWRKPEPLETDL